MAILINAVVITLLYFPEYKDNEYLILLDELFVVLFLVEAIVKIVVLKPKAYFSNAWNRFDFIIVLGSLPSLLIHFMHLLPVPTVPLLTILRMFRLVRFVRFIRFIRFVPHLGKIMSGLGRALKSSVFVLIALLFLNFLLSIFTCHFYGEMVPEYFGNPLISSYSIFQMFTIEGWNEIPATIAEKMEGGNGLLIGLTRLYFVAIVLVGGIFGMSMANAIFVDEMTMDNTDAIELKIDKLQRDIEELKEILKRKE